MPPRRFLNLAASRSRSAARRCRPLRRAFTALALAALGCGSSTPTGVEREPATAVAATSPGLRALRTLGADPTEPVRAVLTFRGGPPTEAQLATLRALGLEVQGMKRLPLALARGPIDRFVEAIATGAAVDAYPDERLQLHWDVSNATMRVPGAHALGVTGKGVQVAIVDTGVDATHPDLADHVPHNVKLVGPEYVDQPHDSPPGTLVIAMDEGPYSNTDTSGHGTHVAGIVAADGTTSEAQVGVAPDAEIIGYGTGDVLFIFTAVASYDHILDHPDWGIDVVNNSWGSSFAPFDPDHPINVATKAAHDAGITVVFAAGNSGSDNAEMTMNPYSVAPWVISVASGTVSAERSGFSSNGLENDNSRAEPLADDHVAFEGDRIGIYRPDVMAPGSSIESSCGPTSVILLGCAPGGTASASGTSMAAPHVAGAAALLREVVPDLSPTEVQQTLEATAFRPTDGSPFWQAGFGHVDATAAVTLAGDPGFAGKLTAMHVQAEKRVLAERAWQVIGADLWTWLASPVTVEGVPDTREFTIDVDKGCDAVKAVVKFPPTDDGLIGINLYEYRITVLDAAGTVVGQSDRPASEGVSKVLVDLRELEAPPAYGEWKVRVEGLLATAADGARIALHVARLLSQVREAPPEPQFVADGTLRFHFQPDGATSLVSPEGCQVEDGPPEGGLATTTPGDPCHAGAMGWPVNRTLAQRATFTSEPLAEAHMFGGEASFVLHLVDPARTTADAALEPVVFYTIEAVTDEGATPVAAGETTVTFDGTRVELPFTVPPVEVAAGTRLVVRIGYSSSPLGAPTSASRMVYGGQAYGESGVTLTYGHLELPRGPDAGMPDAGMPDAGPPPADESVSFWACRVAPLPGGSSGGPLVALVVGLALGALRLRRRR